MLFFCPRDGTALDIEKGPNGNRFFCINCPYICDITEPIISTTYPKLKEVGDVMGGPDAWESVDRTDATCPKCNHRRAFFQMIQTRSADEPMTIFYRCCDMSCAHRWRDG